MTKPLRALILEDYPADAELAVAELQRAGFELVWDRVETQADFLAALSPDLDVVLADYNLPQFDALRALDLMQERGLAIPCIVVTGAIGEELAVECLRRGAADYLLKDRLARLGPAVVNAIETKQANDQREVAESALQESEELYRAVVENANDGITIRSEGKLVFANTAFLRLCGLKDRSEVVGQPEERFIHPEDRETVRTRSMIRRSGGPSVYEYRVLRPDGETRIVQASTSTISFHGRRASLRVLRDVTEARNTELALRESEAEIARRAHEDAVLAVIGRIISSSPDIDQVYERFADQIRRLIPFDRIALCDIDVGRGVYTARYIQGISVPGMDSGQPRPLQRSLVAEAARSPSGLVKRFNDAEEVRAEFPHLLDLFRAGLRTAVGVPLVSRDNVTGVMFLASTTPEAYGDKALELANRVGDQIAGAIANAKLHAELELEAQDREALAEIGRIVTSSLDIDDIYGSFAELVRGLIPFDRLSVNLVDEAEGVCIVRYADGMAAPGRDVGDVFPLGDSFTATVIGGRSRLCVPGDIGEPRQFPSGMKPFLEAGMRSFLGAPLVNQGTVHGALLLGSRTPQGYSVASERLVKRVADQIAGAIANSLLFAERQKAEEALRETEEKYRTVVENANDSIVVVQNGMAVFRNRTYGQLLGYTDAESQGQRFLDIVAAEDRERVRNYYQKRAEGQEAPDQYEIDLITRGGTRVSMEVRPRVIDYQGNQATLVVMRDVTERRLAEQAIREGDARYRSVVNSTGDAVISIDSSGKIVAWNPAAERVFGYSGSEVLGQPLSFAMPERFVAQHERALRRLEAGGAMSLLGRTMELVGRRKDGSEFPMDLSLATWDSHEGRFYTGFIRDVTERKQLERQFIQAQKLEAVGQMAGGIAHDFNNVLTAVLSYSQLGQMHLPQGDRVHAYLQEIEKAGERAAHLTRQLLTFSRHQVIEPRVLDLNEVILEVERMLRRLISEDIELVTLLESGEPCIKADPGQIEQVIMNMAVNARDAMPDGGKLIVETQAVTLDEAYARVHADVSPGEYVRLSVGDTGVGMTEEVKARVFEPFFTTKEVGKGTGLGLSTCYGIVKQSGGHITVCSAPGEGTTFEIFLPKVRQEVDAKTLHDDIGYLPVGGETVMLVEDEAIVREAVSHILREQGYTVTEAANGLEALRIAEDFEVDEIQLLITDIVMPLMGGVELAEQFRAGHPNVKVLYVSGYIDDSLVSRAIVEERAEYMQKPFTPAVLARKVREILDQ